MYPIITQPGLPAHVDPDDAARRRRDRLAMATPEQMESALAFLSAVSPETFEIAMSAAAPLADETFEDTEPLPVCRECGALVGIFLARGLHWQHFRGDATTSGAQEVYDPGHPAVVTWILPSDSPEDL